MKLSDDLKKWRADRPDEWTMKRFIDKAIEIETLIDNLITVCDCKCCREIDKLKEYIEK
jgi:hypothetical protein